VAIDTYGFHSFWLAVFFSLIYFSQEEQQQMELPFLIKLV